jgi:Flp pilus assembly protein TadG
MRFWRKAAAKTASTWLGRLRRDTRGNTLAIMAATLVPLAGMVGGGLDASRMYITKTRLQHACDAGALAGRRQMGGGNWGTDDSAAANKFFDSNYITGSFGTDTLTRAFSENAGKVIGTASARVPMTLMKVLGLTEQTLAVRCEAEMRLPNSDVMFVLDNTGSMNEILPGGGGTSRMAGLRVAVKCFYQIVAQLDINDVTCATGEPTGGTSDQVPIRFGFMPYSSNVNVGKLLPPSYFANNWTYQTRSRSLGLSAWSDWLQYNYTYPNAQGNCTYTNTATSEMRNPNKGNHLNGQYGTICRWEYRYYGPLWAYGPQSIPVGQLKSGSTWNSTFSFSLPINNDGSNRTVVWDGCIEERPTVRTTNYNPIPANAHDLNIDLVPTQGNSNSLWGPALDQVLFYRNVTSNLDQATESPTLSATNFYNPNASCPTEARRLQEYNQPDPFRDYVNSLTAVGNTYHDIGMLWGARFMSPTGIFAADNATSSTGGQIQRHMIFMTDGDSTSSPCDYNAYGIPWYDKRQTTDVGPDTECGSNRQALIDQIDLRLVALCKAVKAKGITLWVISYGGGVDAANEARLETCSSPANAVTATHYFKADNAAALQTSFAAIANNISQLRLTQ